MSKQRQLSRRSPISFVARFALAVCAVAAPLCGETLLVDAGGGGDFLDIQSAVNAASPGDVVLVVPGSYLGFSLDMKQLVIMGQGHDVVLTTPITVVNIPAGPTTAVVDLKLQANCRIDNCSGPIVLDGISTSGRVDVNNSADVRITRSNMAQLHSSNWDHALTITNSRVEITESNMVGADGLDCACCGSEAGAGGNGIHVDVGGQVSVYRSNAQGGPGGFGGLCSGPNDGGDGVYLVSSASALVAGEPAHTLSGGMSGGPGALAGKGLRNGGQARVSGVTVSSITGSGFLEFPVPKDPTLRALAAPQQGQVSTLRVTAEPGSQVLLILGRHAIVSPYAGLEEDLLVTQARTVDLGAIDASGSSGINLAISSALPVGTVFFVQAQVTLPAGELRYSNSVPLVVR